MASMTGLTPQQLAQLLDGPNPMPMPSYNLPAIYDGVLPVGLGVQGTKHDRGVMADSFNSLNEPWGGAYDQTVYRNSNTGRDIIRNVPAPLPETRTATLDAADPLNINNLGLTRQSFFAKQETPAERAIAEITINGGMNSPSGGLGRGRRTLPRLPTMPDPLLAEATAIGGAYKPSAKVQAALAAPPPPGSSGAPQARSGGLLGMLLGAFGSGQPAASGGGLGALLSGGMGGHDTSSPEAFAASVTRPSNIPGVEQFTGKVEMGQAGQNRYGSTARNELLRLYT